MHPAGWSGEEIVECGNVSKSGFSFRSRKAYVAGSERDAALPYYTGARSRFSWPRGSSATGLVLPNNNFHYGVMYALKNRIPKP